MNATPACLRVEAPSCPAPARKRAETDFGVQGQMERIPEIRLKRLITIRAILSLRLMSLWLSV